jgi:hypothetical protein
MRWRRNRSSGSKYGNEQVVLKQVERDGNGQRMIYAYPNGRYAYAIWTGYDKNGNHITRFITGR